MTHRFDDMHDCKPVKQSEQYQKLKKNTFNFNWSSKGDIKKGSANQKKELSFGDKFLRFCVCCSVEDKKDKKNK